jgi:hypothetical protein
LGSAASGSGDGLFRRSQCHGHIDILYTRAAFGTLIGSAAAGFAFDFAHSYLTPILSSAICNVVAAMVMAVTSSQRTNGNRVAAKV